MKTAFKLRSGNVTPFKQMGSSPVKQSEKTKKAAKDKLKKKVIKKAGGKLTAKGVLASTGVGLVGTALWEAGEIGYNAIQEGSLKKGYEKWKQGWKDIGSLF